MLDGFVFFWQLNQTYPIFFGVGQFEGLRAIGVVDDPAPVMVILYEGETDF